MTLISSIMSFFMVTPIHLIHNLLLFFFCFLSLLLYAFPFLMQLLIQIIKVVYFKIFIVFITIFVILLIQLLLLFLLLFFLYILKVFLQKFNSRFHRLILDSCLFCLFVSTNKAYNLFKYYLILNNFNFFFTFLNILNYIIII